MHELSICQQLLTQVRSVAQANGAARVERIVVAAGPLSGVEPALLQQAFTLARAGTLAADAELEILVGPVVVRCRQCHAEGEAAANRLLCPACSDWQVDLVQGDELMLKSVDLAGLAAGPATPHKESPTERERHV